MDINLESHRDGHHEKTVGFEDGGGLIVVHNEVLADKPDRTEIKDSGGFLSASPPPNRLEHYPAQPELMGGG